MPGLGSAPIPGVRADDHVRGGADLPLVVVYGDFACPRCAVAWERLAGEPVRMVFRHFALKAKHPRAPVLAAAAEAAGRQDAFWAFHDALFADQGRMDDPHLWARAQALGLDVERFDADRRGEEVAARVSRDVRGAMRAGVAASPTLVSGDVLHPGPPEEEWLANLHR